MKCRIDTGMPLRDIASLLQTELARQHPRSDVRLEGAKGNAVITITADDASAMRAALNGVTSVLSIYEKTDGITH